MQLSHERWRISARFDDPNLVSCVGLVPVSALAARAGLPKLLERLSVPAANAAGKLLAVVLGMVAGADSILDLDLLRHGGMRRVFGGVRAPSTLGTFLRSFTFGHVRQLDAVAARLLPALTRWAPLLPGADQLAYLDLDDTVRETHGYAKQGAGRGYTGVNGLNVLLATLSTPGSVPVIAAAGRAGARFSVTLRHTPSVLAAIAAIDAAAWTPIEYPHAVWDDEAGRWVSDAEVAEIVFTAFTGRRQAERVTARLIVRRVRRLNPEHAPASHAAQGELFAAYRYHAVFTDSPTSMLAAEAAHRDHAVVEQVIADLKNSALAHLPSGVFAANGAWLACAVIAYNLTRAAGALAGAMHTKARTATLRTRLITVPARIARSARRQALHLPRDWPWEVGLDELLRAALHDPLTATIA
jgi:hypothetical protein